MATFKAFKPEAMQRIARSMGHMGDMNQFENFLMANPDKSAMMRNYNARAMQMAEGGVVKKMQEGGDTGTGTEVFKENSGAAQAELSVGSRREKERDSCSRVRSVLTECSLVP